MERPLIEYFNPQHEYYLDNIEYKRIEIIPNQQNLSLSCTDNIRASAEQNGVKLVVTRSLQFDPNGIFELVVSFGALLSFNDLGNNVDWASVNLSDEFATQGEFVTSNLLNRMSLLIGQITSSYGQQPIILPGVMINNNQTK